MISGFYTVRINFRGGIASPGELRDLLLVLRCCEVQKVRFGLRQQLIFYLSYLHETTFTQRMTNLGIAYYLDRNVHPNIVSSYVSEEVFQQGNWLSEGIYKDIFDTFDYKPKLKINISDSGQSFTPFFSGHINFISAGQPNFWHVYVRTPQSNKVRAYDRLVFSNEIGKIASKIEQNLHEGADNFFENLPISIAIEKDEKLRLPKFSLPYYEGFNRYGKKSWLGIYKRDELFRIDFLLDLCNLCLHTKIGEICLTPWKSLIIKNINEGDRKRWSSLLSKYDINVRHAANELNWQVEDASPNALKLKHKLIRYFNKKDLRTFGICLGIKTVPRTEVFASILVTKRAHKWLPFVRVFDVTYTTDYDPNGREVAYFAKGIWSFQLCEKLRKSILQFNRAIAEEVKFNTNKVVASLVAEPPQPESRKVHQCSQCFTIYDPVYGDELNGILPNEPFEKLPKTYSCPVCRAEKNKFKAINSTAFVQKFN